MLGNEGNSSGTYDLRTLLGSGKGSGVFVLEALVRGFVGLVWWEVKCPWGGNGNHGRIWPTYSRGKRGSEGSRKTNAVSPSHVPIFSQINYEGFAGRTKPRLFFHLLFSLNIEVFA